MPAANEIARSIPVQAVEEYRFLLERGYPGGPSLSLVGNRHTLDYSQRRLLHRAIFSPAQARRRREKLVSPDDLFGARVAVDGYNLIITLENGLGGKQLIMADDGVVRDIAGISSGYRPSDATAAAMGRAAEALTTLRVAGVVCLFLSSMSRSGEMAASFAGILHDRGIPADCRAEKCVEMLLPGKADIVITANSAIMDRSARVFDLAGHILRREPGVRIMLL